MRGYLDLFDAHETPTLIEASFGGSRTVQWQTTSDRTWVATFAIGDRQFSTIFTNISRGSGSGRQTHWRVDFRKETWVDARAGVRDTVAVLDSVAAAVKEFLDRVQPITLEMSPTTASREKLYRAVLARMTPMLDHAYSLDEKWYGTLFGEFVLTRRPEWLRSGWTGEDRPTDDWRDGQ